MSEVYLKISELCLIWLAFGITDNLWGYEFNATSVFDASLRRVISILASKWWYDAWKKHSKTIHVRSVRDSFGNIRVLEFHVSSLGKQHKFHDKHNLQFHQIVNFCNWISKKYTETLFRRCGIIPVSPSLEIKMSVLFAKVLIAKDLSSFSILFIGSCWCRYVSVYCLHFRIVWFKNPF